MKMTGEDYKLLRAQMLSLLDFNVAPGETRAELVARLTEDLKLVCPNVKDHDLSLRWRLFATAMARPHPLENTMFHGMMGLRGKLYAYLDDEHIDTALRKIFREL